MERDISKSQRIPICAVGIWLIWLLLVPGPVRAQEQASAAPVVVSTVRQEWVAENIVLIGTTEAVHASTVAAEVAGVVEAFSVREGDYVEKGALLAKLGATDLKLRMKAAKAARESIRAGLVLAEKELERVKSLKISNSVAAKQYDEAFFNHSALVQELRQSDAEIERMAYEISRKNVTAPFSGYIAKEYTAVGQWVQTGGPIVRLMDLSRVTVEVDVPEKIVVKLERQGDVWVRISSFEDPPLSGAIKAILPQGDPVARTFPVHIEVPNVDGRIRSGMESIVTFAVGAKKQVLVVAKDAVVTSGDQRLVYKVKDDQSVPVTVVITGYYDGDAAVEGDLAPGDMVVVRGNERLRPGQAVRVMTP